MKRASLLCIPLVVLLTAVAAPVSHGQLLEFRFNDSGTTTSSSVGTAQAEFKDSSGTAADLHGSAGSGVSGVSGDFAFNNTASTFYDEGGRADVSGLTSLNSLTSFTLSGWYRTSEESWAGAVLIQKNATANNQFSLAFATSSKGGNKASLGLVVGTATHSATGTQVTTGMTSELAPLDTWIFFAVTYDGTKTSDNVIFYYGTTETEVMQIGTTQTINAGALEPLNTANLVIGNNKAGIRPWDGFLDNIRIFGTTTGSSGVLNQGQLEALRSADIATIPEPTSYAMVLLGAGALFAARRRLRRH